MERNTNTLPNIIRTITSSGKRWACQITRIGEKRNPYVAAGKLGVNRNGS
jgi:hypothetical protein